MTSILTNISAMSALQTLRSVSSGLNDMQDQVSTGLRVKTASDNVAYWSISTTMRSDNKSISAANDALGVGAAKVDTAYAGTSSIIDILSDVKAKLVTAKEDSADKAQIQNEISQLGKQAESIVRSSSFSGVNYLQTYSGDHINNIDVLDDYVVDSFTRNADGTTTINTSKVDMRATSMLNDFGGGILQKDDLDYYMPLRPMVSDNFRHEGHEDHYFDGPITFSGADSVQFDLLIDNSPESAGESFHITINKAVVDAVLGDGDGMIADVYELRRVMQQAFVNVGADAYADVYGTQAISSTDPYRYEIRSLETSPNVGSSIVIDNITSTFLAAVEERKLGLDTPSLINHDNLVPNGKMNFPWGFKVMLDATISFDVSIDNSPLKTYVIDRAAVDAGLGTTDGRINSAADLKAIVDLLVPDQDGLFVEASSIGLTFRADQALFPGYGTKAVDFYISSFRPDPPFTLRFDLSEIDVSTDTFSIDEYLEGVEHMLGQSIDSAAMLGSIQQRIELQTDFSHRMMDEIDSGVSRLADADMEEASMRLQALQTQKQLAVQSLQIANSGTQNILSLFG
jgi:flagellin